MTLPRIGPVTLEGRAATLVPLDRSHHDELCAAASEGALWELWYTSVPSPVGMAAEIERRLALAAAGSMVPFTVLRDGRAVGMTTYMHVDHVHQRLEIGSTWLAASAQRTGVNTTCKRLLLGHAFDTLACIAVELRTHWMNHQSRRAIERLGAKLDGVLRSHQRLPDGSLRDTCVYSITAAEWPAVRAHLDHRLARLP